MSLNYIPIMPLLALKSITFVNHRVQELHLINSKMTEDAVASQQKVTSLISRIVFFKIMLCIYTTDFYAAYSSRHSFIQSSEICDFLVLLKLSQVHIKPSVRMSFVEKYEWTIQYRVQFSVSKGSTKVYPVSTFQREAS